jgi:hypothetical protein
MPEEEIIYSDSRASISTSRVVIDGKTYALRNITSVKMSVTPANRGCAIALITVGAILAMVGLAIKGGIGGFVVGLIVLGIGVLWAKAAKEQYHVAIASSSTEGHALTSPDRPYIQKIVDAVNEAIIRYR